MRSYCHLSNVLALYQFDSELKTLLFSSIQHIEIAVRTQMIQKFSMKYGSFWFMNKRLFANEEIFQKHLTSLQKALERTKSDILFSF
ncbi:MAG: Abi family protein [Bacteroidales bacterium]|nr:Abi family protein [Bacteroidales bacterium]